MFQRWWRPRKDSGKSDLADRRQHPEVVARAELPAELHELPVQRRVQLRDHLSVRQPARMGTGDPPRLRTDEQAACELQVFGIRTAQRHYSGPYPGIQ